MQGDQGINTQGQPTIPRVVFEELVANALIHRDYLISSTIRIFVFADRIEITSPGHLPNHLTVAKIRSGTSITRNPILVSLAAQGLLPYRGLGTGIRRALDDWPAIEFTDDRDGNQFTATVYRQTTGTSATTQEATQEADGGGSTTQESPRERILAYLRARPEATRVELSGAVGLSQDGVKYHLKKLTDAKVIRHVGPTKGGHWEVLDL